MTSVLYAALVGLIAAVVLAVREWSARRRELTAEQRGRLDALEAVHKAALAAARQSEEDAEAVEEHLLPTLRQPISDRDVADLIARSKGKGPLH